MTDSTVPLPRVAANALPTVAAELLERHVVLCPWQAALDGDRSIEGLFVYGHPRVDRELLDRLPGLKVISNHGVGVDHIDLAAAAAHNIPVGNTPGVLDGAVADMAMALVLAAARRMAEGVRYARSAEFTKFDPSLLWGRDVHGSTLGILGLGNIGYQVARRARGFDMQVLYHNRRRREDAETETAARYVTFDALLEQSDFLVLAVPLSPSTRGLIGAAQLARMKSTATLVNVSRGAVVDTHALTEAMQAGRVFAAALDVTDPEPLPRNHPLLRMDNVTVLPHLGSATVQTRQRMSQLAVENLLCGLRGRPLRHEVRHPERRFGE